MNAVLDVRNLKLFKFFSHFISILIHHSELEFSCKTIL